MLRELSIRNLAVIEEVRVCFHNGFHVLTGETGAGKSILIDALSLLIGARGSSDMVRYGCDKAEMEALFELSQSHPVWKVMEKLGLAAASDDVLIIRRELTSHGKSSCRINGSIVNMTMLREVGECLVNVHGQHEHQSLLKSEHHLKWLDLFAGAELEEVKAQYQSTYFSYQQVKQSLKQVEDSSRKNMQLIDLYRFQIEEIEAANLKVDEEDALMEERSKMSHTEKIMHNVSEAYALLFGASGLEAFSKAIQRIEDIKAYDSANLLPVVEQLKSAFYQAEDAVFQLRDYKDSVQNDPERLAEISDRLDLIHTLKRKYGESIPDILAYAATISAELDLLDNRESHLQNLMEQSEKLYAKSLKLGQKLSVLRQKAGDRLSVAIEQELKQLGMSRTIFQVHLDRQETNGSFNLSANGIDDIAFMLAPNPGEPLKALSKIASGGEMSRIMLALKSIFAAIDQVPVLVFDEVDTGVSGRAAQAIAEKMSRLSDQCQVFSITHLPQVACMADYHYEISKQVHNERTATSVKQLGDKERIEELARMLGGVEITDKTRHHAQEMLHLADRQKGA